MIINVKTIVNIIHLFTIMHSFWESMWLEHVDVTHLCIQTTFHIWCCPVHISKELGFAFFQNSCDMMILQLELYVLYCTSVQVVIYATSAMSIIYDGYWRYIRHHYYREFPCKGSVHLGGITKEFATRFGPQLSLFNSVGWMTPNQ